MFCIIKLPTCDHKYIQKFPMALTELKTISYNFLMFDSMYLKYFLLEDVHDYEHTCKCEKCMLVLTSSSPPTWKN